jgi:preprotein translocase subunit SecE
MAKATTADSKQSASADKPIKTGKPGKAAPPSKPGVFARIGNYSRDVRSEMKRVVWPTRPEIVNSSVVVIATLLFFIAFIALTDLVVQQIISVLGAIKIGG